MADGQKSGADLILDLARLGLAAEVEAYAAIGVLATRRFEVEPEDGDALLAKGIAEFRQGQKARAEGTLRRHQEKFPDDARCVETISRLWLSEKRGTEVIGFLEQVKDRGIHAPVLDCCRAAGYLENGDFDAAVEAAEAAIQAGASDYEANLILGTALRELGRLEEAEQIARRIASDFTETEEAHGLLAQVLLLQGKVDEGFREMVWRFCCSSGRQAAAVRAVDLLPCWQGESVSGKRLILRQGTLVGDTIQFIRYVPALVALGAEVIVECPKDLHAFVQNVSNLGELVTPDTEVEADFQVPLMSLPAVFAQLPEAEVLNEAYLLVEPSRIEHACARLSAFPRPWIGVLPGGDAGDPPPPFSSLPTTSLAPFLNLKGPTFVAIGAAWHDTRVLNLTSELRPGPQYFPKMAAFLSALDLIVTVDTSSHHIAGALGQPCWLMLRHAPDWRWGMTGNTTPWYPHHRVFRQPSPGDWDGMMADLLPALDQFVQAWSPSR